MDQPVELVCLEGCPSVATYGNRNLLEGSTSFTQETLLCNPVSIPSCSVVTHLGVTTNGGGSNGKLALYADDGGQPGPLAAATASTPIPGGSFEIGAVQATPIQAGDYWVCGIFDALTMVRRSTADPNIPVRYRSLPFASALPDPFGTSQSYTGETFNLWVTVAE